MSLGRRTSILALRLVEGALALAAIVAWSIAVIGRVVSDSVPSLQKLAWIPVPVIAMARAAESVIPHTLPQPEL